MIKANPQFDMFLSLQTMQASDVALLHDHCYRRYGTVNTRACSRPQFSLTDHGTRLVRISPDLSVLGHALGNQVGSRVHFVIH